MTSDLQRLHGVIPATVTPFGQNERIDYGALRDAIEAYLAAGVHGISITGSQGEFYALSTAERIELVRHAVEIVAGRTLVYAGTGAVTTRETIELTLAAQAGGVDVAMVITPYFISPSVDELAQHYLAVARATRLPIVLYNNPPRTGINVNATQYVRIAAAAENVIGIKDSSGDLTQLAEYLLLSEHRARVFIGRDTLVYSGVLHGAAGAISPAANVFPRTVVRLYEALRAQRLDEARRLSELLAPLRAAWAWGSFPVVIKEAMELAGRRAGPARAPIASLAPETRDRLRAIVTRIAVEEARV